jgi:hypothetical protein
MKKYTIMWVNTGRREVLVGHDLKSAFYREGIQMFYGTDKYKVLSEEEYEADV